MSEGFTTISDYTVVVVEIGGESVTGSRTMTMTEASEEVVVTVAPHLDMEAHHKPRR